MELCTLEKFFSRIEILCVADFDRFPNIVDKVQKKLVRTEYMKESI